MLTYEQWKQHQQELEDRAKYVFDKLQPILKSWNYGKRGYEYWIGSIDTDRVHIYLISSGETVDYYFDTVLLFYEDSQLQFYIQDELDKIEYMKEQDKKQKEYQTKKELLYERLRTNG